jgi:hypothetical protein
VRRRPELIAHAEVLRWALCPPSENRSWGSELDIRRLDDGQARGEIAGYLAKYATKSTEQAGGVLHRVTEHEVDRLPVRDHVRAYMREAFALAEDAALADRRFASTAHAFGYRGHCLTKSRGYSTTFKALRHAREEYVHEQLRKRSSNASQQALATAVERKTSFRYVGMGHLTAADAYLAASAAARAREHRLAAREALALVRLDGVTTEGSNDGDSGCRGRAVPDAA